MNELDRLRKDLPGFKRPASRALPKKKGAAKPSASRALPVKKETPHPGTEVRPPDTEAPFNIKTAKEFLGAKMFATFKVFFEYDFNAFFYSLTDSQKITVIHNFMDKYYPKEIKIEQEDPFDEWTTEELKAFDDYGIKPKGKVIYVGK